MEARLIGGAPIGDWSWGGDRPTAADLRRRPVRRNGWTGDEITANKAPKPHTRTRITGSRGIEPDHAYCPHQGRDWSGSGSSIGICRTSSPPASSPVLGHHKSVGDIRLAVDLSCYGKFRTWTQETTLHPPSSDVKPACIPFQEDLCDPRRENRSKVHPRQPPRLQSRCLQMGL